MQKTNFDKIRNPETNRWVSIYGKAGQKVLKKYLTLYGGNINIKNNKFIHQNN
tara:strand:+ start:519 stop:677 length:159 start_codon:yes stop_codon:yes gene_type:complete